MHTFSVVNCMDNSECKPWWGSKAILSWMRQGWTRQDYSANAWSVDLVIANGRTTKTLFDPRLGLVSAWSRHCKKERRGLINISKMVRGAFSGLKQRGRGPTSWRETWGRVLIDIRNQTKQQSLSHPCFRESISYRHTRPYISPSRSCNPRHLWLQAILRTQENALLEVSVGDLTEQGWIGSGRVPWSSQDAVLIPLVLSREVPSSRLHSLRRDEHRTSALHHWDLTGECTL